MGRPRNKPGRVKGPPKRWHYRRGTAAEEHASQVHGNTLAVEQVQWHVRVREAGEAFWAQWRKEETEGE